MFILSTHFNDKAPDLQSTIRKNMKKSECFIIIAVFTFFKSSKAQEELSKCESAVEKYVNQRSIKLEGLI